MDKGGYGKGLKAVILFFEVIFVVLSVVCVGVVSCNAVINVPNRNNTQTSSYYISPFSKTADFEDSDVFRNMVYDNLNEIIRYSVIRSQLETEGVFDENKKIDIEQYARHFEEIPVAESSVKYRLGDLIQWGQLRDGLSLKEYLYEDVADMILKAHGIENREPVYTEDRYVLVPVERYKPVSGDSLLSYVDSVEELELMTYYLQQTIGMLGENYNSYKEYKDYFNKEEINLQYCVSWSNDNVTEIYSNVDMEGKSKAEINAYFTSFGRYLCFNPAEFAYESNTSIREEDVRNIWSSYSYAYPDNMSVWIGIDTQFPYMDAFCIAEENYRLAAPGYLFILFSIACGLMAFILLGVMTKMAGRGKGMAEIRLIWFDRWYTELSALIGIAVVVAMTLGVGGIVSFFYVESDRQPEMLIALGVGTAIVWLMFLFFYLSLIRRIKAGTIWKNMLVYRIYLRFRNLLMSIYDDSRNVVRIWVPYLLFIGMNMLLSTMKYGWIVALLVDFFVGVFLYRNHKIQRKILEGIGKIRNGDFDYQIETEEMHGDNRILADAVNSIGNGIREAVKTSMKDERMKADLITNVSHDIKTPLTSIINYVALIKRESVENEKVKQYLEILDSKSQRLKQLTEDLVEASKISSGNIELQCDNLDFVELLNQTVGEFSEKFEEKELQMIMTVDEKPLLIYADSRRIWRVVDNLFQNVCKYALEKTRVYTELKRVSEEDGSQKVQLSIKNISAQPLRVGVEDLTERFIRGDASRSTEGSGLGLSIAKNLTELQKGKFEIISDGDLFKVVITFPLVV